MYLRWWVNIANCVYYGKTQLNAKNYPKAYLFIGLSSLSLQPGKLSQSGFSRFKSLEWNQSRGHSQGHLVAMVSSKSVAVRLRKSGDLKLRHILEILKII